MVRSFSSFSFWFNHRFTGAYFEAHASLPSPSPYPSLSLSPFPSLSLSPFPSPSPFPSLSPFPSPSPSASSPLTPFQDPLHQIRERILRRRRVLGLHQRRKRRPRNYRPKHCQGVEGVT
jgi:hypothetical protein